MATKSTKQNKKTGKAVGTPKAGVKGSGKSFRYVSIYDSAFNDYVYHIRTRISDFQRRVQEDRTQRRSKRRLFFEMFMCLEIKNLIVFE